MVKTKSRLQRHKSAIVIQCGKKTVIPFCWGWCGFDPHLDCSIFNKMEEKIKTQFKCLIVTLDSIITMVEEQGLTNEQWFLDYLDEINKLSVKF